MLKKLLVLALFLSAGSAGAELKPEPLGRVETLPVPYPPHWVIAHDAAFHHMLDGKFILLDAESPQPGRLIKGTFNGSFVGHFAQSAARKEFYVSETFFSRGSRGERTDVVTIYDMATLAPKDEILLPGAKRGNMIPGRYNLHVTNDGSLLLSYNFNPATSISVIDIDAKRVVNEITLPSCALAYPTGKRGFSSLCGNGDMVSFQLDKQGQVASQQRFDPFFDVDKDALFEKPAIINGVGYFPTFQGYMQEIDFNGDLAKVGRRWDMLSKDERAANWRPGGLQLTAADGAGRMYVIMHPDGHEGTHKDGGPEVWVYDVKKRARVQRIELKNWGISVEVTQDKEPLMLIINPESMTVDVYTAKTGEYRHTLGDFGQETPLLLHAVR